MQGRHWYVQYWEPFGPPGQYKIFCWYWDDLEGPLLSQEFIGP